MRKKIRTAVIGTGSMGKHHVRVLGEISHLVGVADISKSLGEALATQYKTKYYQDYRVLIQNEKPEAVVVAVPTNLHAEVALYCLKNNIPTLVEKPIASSLKEAQLLVSESKRRNIYLMVGHIERFNPAVKTLKKFMEQGRFGKIISLLSIRVGLNPPKTAKSDVFLDLGIHDIDIFNFLLNEFPIKRKIMKTKLFAHTISDSAMAILEYRNKTAMIQTNWITPIKMRKLYISATEGYGELDYVNQKLILYDKPLTTKYIGNFFELVSLSENIKREIYISRKEPLKEELHYFLSNINSPHNKDVNFSLEALKIALD